MSSQAPWLSHYDAGVPATLAPYPGGTLVDALADAARERPRQAALAFKGAMVSYAELERASDACAAAFASLGVKRSDRVALLLPNCPQFFIAQYGAWKLGAIVAPLNPIYTEAELEGPLREHGIETLVTLTRYYPRVKRLQARTGVRRIIATNIKEYFPPVLRVLFTLFRERHDGDRVAVAPGDHDFAHLLLINRGRRPPPAALTAADPAVLLMSGGTTGTPKGVLGTHGAYVATARQLEAWHASMMNPRGDMILLPLPMFHVYANVASQALSMVTRSTLALVPNPRDLGDLLATVTRVKPAFFASVPALFIGLLNHPDVQRRRVDFSSIKVCHSGSAALLADTKQRFEAMTGGRILEGYGLTESMMACTLNPVQGQYKSGSVGMPMPDVRIRIFDADEGARVLSANEVGEIAMSAPQLMIGYWNRPEETSDALRDHVDEHGTRRWLHTGDLGYLDEDGYLFIIDRKKDLIKTSGYQVWPREIEEVLAMHEAVAEVGVAGVPDPTKGEAVKAWVVPRAGHTVTEHDLRAFCRASLAPYKVPSTIEFRTDLPKTMVGKVLRRALKEEVG